MTSCSGSFGGFCLLLLLSAASVAQHFLNLDLKFTDENEREAYHSFKTNLELVDVQYRTVFGEKVPTIPITANISNQLLEDMNVQTQFCLSWDVPNVDLWQTHNFFDWETFFEDDTHFCLQKRKNREKAQFMRNLYQRQFLGDCSTVLTKRMWSSGWGADMTNLLDGLIHGSILGRPFQVEQMPWHYASPKPHNVSTAVCASQDMFCYFLPMSNCAASAESYKQSWHGEITATKRIHEEEHLGWLKEYLTRPQAWFQRKIYEFTKMSPLQQPCTVMHVRRGDIVLHGRFSRRYHAISEYLNATSNLERNILLLTDDHNAINEALSLHPQYNWMYVNRTRFKGNSGGWENHIPSNDAAYETTVILGTLKLVQQCSGIVKSVSNFGGYLYGSIRSANQSAWYVNVEDALGQQVYDEAHSKTVHVSKSY